MDPLTYGCDRLHGLWFISHSQIMFCLHGIFKDLELVAILIMGGFKKKKNCVFLAFKNKKIWLSPLAQVGSFACRWNMSCCAGSRHLLSFFSAFVPPFPTYTMVFEVRNLNFMDRKLFVHVRQS